MTYTLTDLATRVLRDLGLVGAEETPSAADLAYAEQTISSVVALLRAKEIVIWNGDATSVPEEYFIALSKRIALDVAPSFGLVTLDKTEPAIDVAEKTLRILSQPRPGAPLPLKTDELTQRRFGTYNYLVG